MDQKVILITGASGGMGKSIAMGLKSGNVKLALHSNNNPVEIEENDTIKHFRGDLSEEQNCADLIKYVVAEFGRIDVLINNAGISRSATSWKLQKDDWRETMAVNLDAPFYLIKHAIPFMRQREYGRIINISSVVGQTGVAGTAAYAASKAGLIGLTKTVSKEVASFGITVNALALGYFNTGMISDVPEDVKASIIGQIPVGYLGDPKTVLGTIEWLLSEGSEYITGQTINLNGGLHC